MVLGSLTYADGIPYVWAWVLRRASSEVDCTWHDSHVGSLARPSTLGRVSIRATSKEKDEGSRIFALSTG